MNTGNKIPSKLAPAGKPARPHREKASRPRAWARLIGCTVSLVILLLAVAMPVSAEETQATITLQSGGLVLDSVPNMNFGTRTISSTAMTFSPVDLTPYTVVVSDLRGSPTGWNVTAQLGPFNAAANSLPGANITITGGTVASQGTPPATAVSGITLTSDGTAQRVFYAADSAGANQSTLTWPLANVALNIPASPSIVAGVHTATITWTLTDGPGA